MRPSVPIWVPLVLALAACSKASASAPALEVDHAVARVMPSGTGALYLRVRNDGDTSDRLLAVDSECVADAQLHTIVHEQGEVTMEPAPDGFPVPAHGSLLLEKGGSHVMLFGTHPRGDGSLPVTLHFARAGTRVVIASIEDPLP